MAGEGAASSQVGSPVDAMAVVAAVDGVLASDYPRLDALYKDIHAHPELAFQETRSAAKLAKELREIGFTVTEHVGGTGVVGIYKNGEGPSVMVRTELDALPVEEKTGLPYASHVKATDQGRETYVDHACGHDIHMATWVGTARALVALKAKWKGTLVFVAQPAEETVSGAKAMIDDGFFKRFGKPDYGFALHTSPAPAGTIIYRAGAISSNSDALDLTFNGRGAHGSSPADSIDPVLMAARFTVDVQSVISREKDPAAFGVVTVGAIQTGMAGNVIPDTAVLRGTIRTFDDGVRGKILDGVARTAKAVADMAGAPPPDFKITPGAKAVVNDPELTAKTAAVFKQAFGAKVLQIPAPASGSEDYSEFIQGGVPSMYFFVGGYDPAVIAEDQKNHTAVPMNHSPYFAPAPALAIKPAVEAMALAVISVLSAG